MEFFGGLNGKILYVGMGTGQEILHIPPSLNITSVDLIWNMMEKARIRATDYPGTMRLTQMNVENLGFPDEVFDSILTVCVF